MSDVEIIPVQPKESDEVITALIALRQEYSSESLVDLHSSRHKAMLRACYQRAVDAGILTRINLLAQFLGKEEGGYLTWRYVEGVKTLTVKYDTASQTTEVTVNDVQVFSNRTPGEERLIPGNWWLNIIAETFGRLEAERKSQAIRQETTAREKFIKDFTADI